jgi:anti-anti-sigma factor
MSTEPELIHVERDGEILIVKPKGNLGELEYEECEAEVLAVLKRCESSDFRHVLVDLASTELFGSSAVGWFIELSQRVAARGGQLALCHVSETGNEVLHATKLEGHWPIYQTREAALAALVGERAA